MKNGEFLPPMRISPSTGRHRRTCDCGSGVIVYSGYYFCAALASSVRADRMYLCAGYSDRRSPGQTLTGRRMRSRSGWQISHMVFLRAALPIIVNPMAVTSSIIAVSIDSYAESKSTSKIDFDLTA